MQRRVYPKKQSLDSWISAIENDPHKPRGGEEAWISKCPICGHKSDSIRSQTCSESAKRETVFQIRLHIEQEHDDRIK